MHYQYRFDVDQSSIDENGHVNNVEYVRWMQDAATAHATAVGSLAALEGTGATWVAREHRIKYLKPAFAGETIGVQTWIAGFRKVRSMRKYRFVHLEDFSVLAEGETDWIFVNAVTGKPMTIPALIQDLFTMVPDAADVPVDIWDR